MKYYASLDGETREVELTEEGIRLDGEAVPAELARVPGSPERHLRMGDRGFLFSARRVDGGWEIRAAGRTLVVAVEDERTRAIRELAGHPVGGPRARELRAPMPGLVLEIGVEPGQEVQKGDALVIIEAMKMENELRAEAAGTVAAVEVEEGQTVNQNDLLVTFEEA